MKKLNKKGFTLIELLAVIVILAIVAAVTMAVIVPKLTQAPLDAAETSVKEFNKAIVNACTSNGLENNPYGTIVGYTDNCATATGCSITFSSSNTAAAFIKALNLTGDMPDNTSTLTIKNCQVETACFHFNEGQFAGIKVPTTGGVVQAAVKGDC